MPRNDARALARQGLARAGGMVVPLRCMVVALTAKQRADLGIVDRVANLVHGDGSTSLFLVVKARRADVARMNRDGIGFKIGIGSVSLRSGVVEYVPARFGSIAIDLDRFEVL